MKDWLHIVAVRSAARLGWSGLLGLILLGSCGVYGAWAWAGQGIEDDAPALVLSVIDDTHSTQPPTSPLPPTPTLPTMADSVAIVQNIRNIVVDNGLAWPQAEYRLTPTHASSLATLEIQTSFKGPYPQIRRMLATVLDKEPALALRDLHLSRPNGDTAEVEAKLSWVVFLADGWLDAPAQGAKP